VAFDGDLLKRLDERREVRIETVRPDGTTRLTIIWIVVEQGEVYVRSWKGERGYWYQAAREEPEQVWLVIDKRRVPVVAVSAGDEESISRCSAGLRRKYARSGSLAGMLNADVLHTTMRLEPRVSGGEQ
jgi:hypothetical protein